MAAPPVGSMVFVAVPAANTALPRTNASGTGWAPAFVLANINSGAFAIDGGGTYYVVQALVFMPTDSPVIRGQLATLTVYPTRQIAADASFGGTPTTVGLGNSTASAT